MKSLPMVALRGLTIMPEMVVHFDVSRERSITAVQQAMMEDQKIFLVAQKSIETEDPGQEDVYSIGTVATVRQVIKLPKKIVRHRLRQGQPRDLGIDLRFPRKIHQLPLSGREGYPHAPEALPQRHPQQQRRKHHHSRRSGREISNQFYL